MRKTNYYMCRCTLLVRCGVVYYMSGQLPYFDDNFESLSITWCVTSSFQVYGKMSGGKFVCRLIQNC